MIYAMPFEVCGDNPMTIEKHAVVPSVRGVEIGLSNFLFNYNWNRIVPTECFKN